VSTSAPFSRENETVASVASVLGAKGDGRQRLADLVVQLACDPQSLGLLRGQRSRGALSALALEPVEHLVECLRQRQGLTARPVEPHRPLTSMQAIDPFHCPRQPVYRTKYLAQ
jgi:hypothetical protein